jgi:hypothetical protein
MLCCQTLLCKTSCGNGGGAIALASVCDWQCKAEPEENDLGFLFVFVTE